MFNPVNSLEDEMCMITHNSEDENMVRLNECIDKTETSTKGKRSNQTSHKTASEDLKSDNIIVV